MPLPGSRLVHPRLGGSLRQFYPSLATIERNAGTTTNTDGEVVEAWQPVHVGVPCVVAPLSGVEAAAQSGPYAESTHQVGLRGHYPDILPRMRCVADGKVYDIKLPQSDPRSPVTVLLVGVVS